jgi:hypothetical protein
VESYLKYLAGIGGARVWATSVDFHGSLQLLSVVPLLLKFIREPFLTLDRFVQFGSEPLHLKKNKKKKTFIWFKIKINNKCFESSFESLIGVRFSLNKNRALTRLSITQNTIG